MTSNKHTLGRKLTPEHREKLIQSLKGRVVSEETRKKIGIANKKRAMERAEQKRIKMMENDEQSTTKEHQTI